MLADGKLDDARRWSRRPSRRRRSTQGRAGRHQGQAVGPTSSPTSGGGGGGGSVGGGVDGLNWAALAKCESGGNPRAVNPAGYYGLYQFCLATWPPSAARQPDRRLARRSRLYRAKMLYKRGGAGQWGLRAATCSTDDPSDVTP